jgi:chromosome segregation ATPase
MTFLARLRHPLVILGVVVSLFVGVATIRAAALWTAASSPLDVKPPSIESLQAALATEQARSAALRVRLDELTSRSTEMVAALETAGERIAADATQAEALRTRLDAAKARLVRLEQSLRRAHETAARTSTAPGSTTATTRVQTEEADEHEGDGE